MIFNVTFGFKWLESLGLDDELDTSCLVKDVWVGGGGMRRESRRDSISQSYLKTHNAFSIVMYYIASLRILLIFIYNYLVSEKLQWTETIIIELKNVVIS